MNDGARQIPPRNVTPRRLENGKLTGGNRVWGIISDLRWVPNGVSKVLEVPCSGVAGEPSGSPVCLSPNGAKFPPGCSLGEGRLSGTIVGGLPEIGDRICEDWVVCDQDGATEHGFPSAGIVSAGLLCEFGEVEMLSSDAATYTRFEELKPGDRIEVEQVVTVGSERRTVKTVGTVLRTERTRHGLHFARAADDKVFSDVILLELPDGELTSVCVDEFTVIRRA